MKRSCRMLHLLATTLPKILFKIQGHATAAKMHGSVNCVGKRELLGHINTVGSLASVLVKGLNATSMMDGAKLTLLGIATVSLGGSRGVLRHISVVLMMGR